MKELEFRKLRANEIQVRPTDTKFKGSATLLLYQDARCAMNILDETVGPFGWQKEYKDVNGNIYCGIGIKDSDTNEWVWKWDCGAFTAREDDMQSKADASDATKRAAVCWGIGRELYATPRIKIKCPDNYYYNEKLNMQFTVKNITWDGDILVELTIVDKFGNVAYQYGNKSVQQSEDQKLYKADNHDLLVQFCKSTKQELNDDYLKSELEKFYRYYNQKANDWEKSFEPSKLWNNWVSRIKNVQQSVAA